MASNAEIVSILWRHHGMVFTRQYTIFLHKTSNILVKNMLVILQSLTELHGAFLIYLGVKHNYILCNCFIISRRKSAPTCFPLINVGGKFGATTGTMRNSWKWMLCVASLYSFKHNDGYLSQRIGSTYKQRQGITSDNADSLPFVPLEIKRNGFWIKII